MRRKKVRKIKKKKRIPYKYLILIGIILSLTIFEFWSVWLGKSHSQTSIQSLETLAGANQPKNKSGNEILFLGDSITARENWDNLFGVSNITNAGISGNTTDDILYRLDPVLNSKPRKIFLMVGINDLFRGKDVVYILTNYKTILSRIQSASPESLIYMESVLPTNDDVSQFGTAGSQNILDLNQGIQKFADGKKIIYLDLYPYFLGPGRKLNAKYSGDGVHPNSEGYAVWKSLVEKYIK